jgi:hypothetical protein
MRPADVREAATGMIRQRGGKRFVAHLLGVSTSVVFVWGSAASADTGPSRNPVADEDVHSGNGTRNHNIFSMKSPTSNRGYQHTSTSTAGGRTNVYNAICRYVRVCTMTWKPGRQKAEPTTRPMDDVNEAPGEDTFFYAGPLGVMMGTSRPAATSTGGNRLA